MAGDCDRDLQLGRGTPSKPDDAIGLVQEADVGSSGVAGVVRPGTLVLEASSGGQQRWQGFLGWRATGWAPKPMAKRARGQGGICTVSVGCAEQGRWAGVHQGTQWRRNGSGRWTS